LLDGIGLFQVGFDELSFVLIGEDEDVEQQFNGSIIKLFATTEFLYEALEVLVDVLAWCSAEGD
jgi:hypothetical protein